MYEELVKKLRDDNACLSVSTLHEAADAIEELSASVAGYEAATDVEFVKEDGHERIRFVPKWMPVTARVPKSETEVLITDGKHINKAYFSEHDGRCSFTFIDSGRNPNGYDEGATHWMPLHTPPKEETK